MLKRMLTLGLAMVMLFCVVAVGSVRAAVYVDDLDALAKNYMNAVESGQASYCFRTTNKDINDVMKQLFSRYPALYHFYDSSAGMIYSNYMELTISFHNTGDTLEDLWVIGSDEELLAVLGIGLLEARTQIRFVTKDGYIPSDAAMNDAIDQLHYRYPVVYMGYQSSGTSWMSMDDYGVRDYTVEFLYHYQLDGATLRQWRQETEQAVLNLTSSLVAQDMPDYQKVLVIHDWIVNHVRYNTADMQEAGNHLAYGALVKGSCVCMGYAEAGVIMFQAAGIETVYIDGEATNSSGKPEGHAWNAVKIDGEWYLVDMTWDDPVMNDGSDVLQYDYFLLTDGQLAKNHTWEYGKFPVCNGRTWNAEKALAAYEQDTSVYTQYNASNYTTLAQSEKDFRQALTSGAEVFNAMQAAHAAENPPPVTMPQATDPMKPEDLPPVTMPQVTYPIDIDTDHLFPAPKPQETQGSGGFGWVIAVIAVVVAAAVVVGVVREKKEQKRRRRGHGGPKSSAQDYVHFD